MPFSHAFYLRVYIPAASFYILSHTSTQRHVQCRGQASLHGSDCADRAPPIVRGDEHHQRKSLTHSLTHSPTHSLTHSVVSFVKTPSHSSLPCQSMVVRTALMVVRNVVMSINLRPKGKLRGRSSLLCRQPQVGLPRCVPSTPLPTRHTASVEMFFGRLPIQ